MEQEILENHPAPAVSPANLETMNRRIEQIYISVEKTRKYFLWTLIITIATIVLPLIALIIIIPIVFRTYSSALGM
jgi:hypothetical protein